MGICFDFYSNLGEIKVRRTLQGYYPVVKGAALYYFIFSLEMVEKHPLFLFLIKYSMYVQALFLDCYKSNKFTSFIMIKKWPKFEGKSAKG